jgi:hypothetical protein
VASYASRAKVELSKLKQQSLDANFSLTLFTMHSKAKPKPANGMNKVPAGARRGPGRPAKARADTEADIVMETDKVTSPPPPPTGPEGGHERML